MLHLAAKAGHAEVVQLVIDDYKLNLTACDKVSEYQAKLLVNHLQCLRWYVLCVVLGCWLSCFSKSVTVSRVDHVAFKSFKEIEQNITVRCACMLTCSTGTVYIVHMYWSN